MKPVQQAFALSVFCTALPVLAADFKPAEGVDARLGATVTFGTTVRMDGPDPDAYARIPSSVVPAAAPGQLVGQTGGSDLNFARHRPVSTVLKALIEGDVHGERLGLFARANAWTDFTLRSRSVPYGNYPNGFTPDAKLSDDGLHHGAKFDGIDLRDIYVYGNADLAGTRVDARLGRQVLAWGTSQFLAGGINSAINPQDYAAQVRPGALPAESKLPVAMLDLRAALTAQWSAEAFAAFESRQHEFPGCGTFFDVASLVPHGCKFTAAVPAPIPNTPLSTISSLTEKSLLQSGYYLHRNDDVPASNAGQFGLALRFKAASIATDFAAYVMNTHSAQPYFRLTVEDVNGATLPAGLAGGLQRLSSPTGVRYSTVFAENVHLLGLSFDTKLGPTANVYGELAHRPNQPLSMNANDLLNGFLLRAPTGLLQQQKNILAIPAGGSFDGFDRFAVTTLNLGGNKVWPDALGAERVVLSGELGWSHVAGLPDPQVMRYGRPLSYGTAPWLVNGALTPCSEAAPGLSGVAGKTCTTDGFITSDAWGLRARAAATYANALAGAALTPSVVLAHDVDGYSYDGTFSKGRTALRLGLRADWGKAYFADVQLTRFSGGRYNLLTDRSNLTLVAGVVF
jgi:Protein of unknown function (DUF1302)